MKGSAAWEVDGSEAKPHEEEKTCAQSCVAALSIKYRPSGSVLEEYGQWEAPNEEEAREKFMATHTHHDVFDMKAPVKDMKDFGEGILEYFYLLKYAAVVFTILAVVPGLFLISFNALGGWYVKADLERTMLGNFGLLSYTGRSTDLNITSFVAGAASTTEALVTSLFSTTVHLQAAKAGGMNKADLLVAMSALDLLGVVIFIFFCVGMIWFVRAKSNAAERNAVTVKDYTVQVVRLPPDTTSAALQDYLVSVAGEGAEVVQVELCRKVNTLLALVLERGQVVDEHDLAVAVVQRTAEVLPKVPVDLEVDVLEAKFRLAELNSGIREEQAASDKNQVVSAFVTFGTAEARYQAMSALPRSRMRQLRMPPEKKFNNGGIGEAAVKPVALDLRPAPEPSDVQYENLEFTKWQRFYRLVATNAAKYIVLLIGFALVSLAPALRTGLSGKGSGSSPTSCTENCAYTDAAGNTVLTTANRVLYKSCDQVVGNGTLPNKLDCEAQTICYECYCRATLNAGNYADVLYCDRFSNVLAINVLAQALAVLGIVVANTMIQYAIGWLTKREKHHTRSREAVSEARGLFITQFINTAFSNLVANMYLPGPAHVIKGSFLDGYIFTGAYADTTPNWYHDVGRPIVISMFINTIIMNLKVVFYWWYRRYKMANRYQSLTQKQLDDSFKGHDFELSIKYGQHLYVIFVVMTYSSGMPFLYIVAALHFTTCYWSEKFELLRVCTRPLAYSRDLAEYVSTTLPFAVLWHLALGVWFYGMFGQAKSSLITKSFERGLESVLEHFRGLMAKASNLTPEYVASRFTQSNSGHLLIAFIFITVALFLFFTLAAWIKLMRWLASLLGIIKDTAASGEAEHTGIPEYGVAVRTQLLTGPPNYSVHQNPAYASAFVRMEEFEWDQKALEAKAKALPANPGGVGGFFKALKPKAFSNTRAGRMRAKRDQPAPAGAPALPELAGLFGLGGFGAGAAAATAGPGGAGGRPFRAGSGNKVAPEPAQVKKQGQEAAAISGAPARAGSSSSPAALSAQNSKHSIGSGGGGGGGGGEVQTLVSPVGDQPRTAAAVRSASQEPPALEQTQPGAQQQQQQQQTVRQPAKPYAEDVVMDFD